MIRRLVLRHLALRPVRSAVFVGAYAAGVAVMLSLLSIGEVMVEQARDEEWVGGGDVTVLPEGVDLETLRLGGAIYYGIEQARFLAREVLTGARLTRSVESAAPWIDDRALYLRPAGHERAVPVRGSGQIPSAARALGAAPDLLSGAWHDSRADSAWLSPTRYQLYGEIDRFHLPPRRVRGDTTWAEWHYFNLLWPGPEPSWLYLTYMVLGDVAGERWGGQLLARFRTPDGRDLVFSDAVEPEQATFSTASPDLAMGDAFVRLADDPVRYLVSARIPPGSPGVGESDNSERGPGGDLAVELEISPGPGRYFPPVELASTDSFVSGYVVPALRATAAGSVCVGGDCRSAGEAIAYHDHNWGTWGGVTWDWGIAHAGPYDVLYGGVHGEDAERARRREAPCLVYVVASRGVAAALQLQELEYSLGEGGSASEAAVPAGDAGIGLPERLTWTATGGVDSVTATISIQEASLTRLGLGGESELYFAQMFGVMHLAGRIGTEPVNASGPGFFETYLR